MIGIYISNLYRIISNSIQTILGVNKVVVPNNFLISPWSDTNISSKTQNADNSWDLVFAATGELKQTIALSPASYTFSIYVETIPADLTVSIDSISPAVAIFSQVIGGESGVTLTRIDYPFTVPSGVSSVELTISSAIGGTATIKNIQINKGALKDFVDITKYYLSGTGNDANTGLSASSPWRNSSKIESLSEGNTVYFERGGTYGTFEVLNSGVSGKKITYTSYGTGAKPIIKDSVLASGWVDEGSGVHSYTNASLPANLLSVIFDGELKGKARTPFYVIDSHSGDASITSSSLTGTPDYTGAEVVIRKQAFIYHVSVIESQTTSTITYGSDLTNQGQYIPIDGYGFFIQNHSSLLTEIGDWWYDGVAKKLYMFFDAGSPASYTVELPLVENAIVIDGKDYIDIQNLSVEVTNSHGILIENSSYIDMSGVESRNCFNDGVSVQGFTSSRITFRDGLIEDCHTGGFYSDFQTDYVTVRDSVVRNIGLIIGAGGYYGNADSRNNGITTQPSTGNLIKGNRVYNIGFNGISPNGSDSICEDNRVDNYCLTKDDGGGIYSSIGASGYVLTNPMVIQRNICTNGIGYAPMTSGNDPRPVHGIYMDDNQHNTQILDNFSSLNALGGLYLHNTQNITVQDNVFSNNTVAQVQLVQNSSLDLNTTVFSNNILSCLSYDQLLYSVASSDNETALIGVFSNNKYYVVRGGMQYFAVNVGGTVPSFDMEFDDFKTIMGTDSTSALTEYQDVDDSISVLSTIFTQTYPTEGSITEFALGGFTFLDKITTSFVADLDTNAAKLDISGIGNAFAYMRNTATDPAKVYRVKFSAISPATEKFFLNYELSWSSAFGPRRSRYVKSGTVRTEQSLLFSDMVERSPNDVILWIFPDGFSSLTIDNVVAEEVDFDFTSDIVNVYNHTDTETITPLGADYQDLITLETVSSVTLAPGQFKTLLKV